CRSDGRGWFDKRCPTGTTCDPGSGVCSSDAQGCLPGAATCTGSPGTAARSVCADDGSGWKSDSCEANLVCDPASGQCAAAVCSPGQSRCDGGPADPDRSTCAADRLSFDSTPCPDGTTCRPTTNGSKCVTQTCTPGQDTCSDDHTAVLRCDETGTAYELVQPCAPEQACKTGACVASENPLGDIVRIQGPNGSLSLSPGRYSVALVHVDTSSDDMLIYPMSVTGAVKDPPAAPIQPLALSLSAMSGAASMMRQPVAHVPARRQHASPHPRAPRPGPVPQDTTERVFQVPEYTSGGTVVLTRTAKLRAAGQYVNLWEDQTTSAAGALLPDAIVSDLLARLDDAVIPRTSTIMGEPTDVDGNGKLDVLFTDVLPDEVAAFSYPSATLFAPGTYEVSYDYGEVVYAHGAAPNQASWEIATLMAHEFAQLIYLGRRLTPFLDDPASVPDWVDADVYAVEGLASVAMGWSGQSWAWPAVAALESPEEMSLWRLLAPGYIQQPEVNLASYGFGTLIQEYLFDQAGGMNVQGAGAVFEDGGGLAHVEQFTSTPSGWDRLLPVDGRPLSSWYVDFAIALLLQGLEGKVSAETAADPRYQFAQTVQDPTYGGFIGPTLRYEHTSMQSEPGPILRPTAWSMRPDELRRGGMSLVALEVDDAGGMLTISDASATAAVVRHLP
ncbi:MAG: hypothetical protein ACOC1F_04320, partial [Myxococcota bacterium]